MTVILLLLAQFGLCWSGKPIDYTPLMRVLDDEIMQDVFVLKKSSLPPETRGQILMNNVEQYIDRLGDVRDMIQQNIFEAYVKAVELQKIGGPQFLKTQIDDAKVMSFYDWTSDSITKLKKEFEMIQEKWKEVEAELKPAEERFKKIHEKDAKEKAEQAKREQERVEKLRKIEEEFSKKVTVNI